jgi:hypothetical protein
MFMPLKGAAMVGYVQWLLWSVVQRTNCEAIGGTPDMPWTLLIRR